MRLSVFYITELCMNVNSRRADNHIALLYAHSLSNSTAVTVLSCNGVHDEQCVLYACSVMRSCLPLLLIQSLCFKNSHVFTQPHILH